MLNRILKLTIVVVFALTGLILTEYLLPYISDFFGYDLYDNGFFGIALATIVSGAVGIFVFGGLGVAVAPVLIYHIMGYTERMAIVLSKVPTSDILVMTLGIGIGLILANLLGGPFSHLPIIGPYIPLIFSLVLSIIGAKVALRKHKDIVGFFNRSIPSLKGAVKPAAVKSLALSDRLYSKNKLLDTSVIIDGRIIDILKTGFLEGRLIVPNFVLEELQKLADSSDNLKRAKGRRGLDLIQEIQQKNKEQLLVEDTDFEDLNEVDAKLVKLAKQTEAVIITNDFNLNKVAEIQGVSVLNINDLANLKGAVKPAAVKSLALSDRLYSKNKLLDTSVIIDGRIIDILKTGFLEGRLIVPNFVLEELQKLADSSDNLKRAKGRRGLDLIQEIQQKNKEQLLVEDTDFEDLNEVDAKLVKLAKQTEAVIITNDFNLNKVAEIQGVSVLNINDLANAIKPVVLPGEEMNVFVVKDGKENNQGVAYLEDGTMIVVEGGKKLVGENTAVVVTSVLQTSAGRMIFAKLK